VAAAGGPPDRKVCVLVAVACAVTLAVTISGPRWFWSAYGGDTTGKFWIQNGLATITAVMLVASLVVRGTTAPLRLALALPLAHLAVIAAAWSAWSHLAPRLADARHNAPILDALPLAPVLLGALALFAIVGRLASRRDPLQGMLTVALAALLAVGLWIITAPQPGPDGIVVARAGKTAFGDLDVALSLWRPCVAYLVIAVAVALPGLVAALTTK
jgi:hypothetical protein